MKLFKYCPPILPPVTEAFVLGDVYSELLLGTQGESLSVSKPSDPAGQQPYRTTQNLHLGSEAVNKTFLFM